MFQNLNIWSLQNFSDEGNANISQEIASCAHLEFFIKCRHIHIKFEAEMLEESVK